MAMSEGMDTARVCFVSEAAGPQLANHIAAGGLVATMRENTQGPLLSLQQGESILGELPMAAIPATWGAKFRPAMINALFASAMAYGLGVSFPKIAQALTGFASDYHGNPGRMNRISGLPFELWLTCADGPRALEEIGAFIAGRGGSGSKSLLFFVAGNRPDDFIRASAQSVAGRFDRYYCTDLDHDRRGRSEGEVTAMLADTLLESGVAEASVVSEPSTKQAVLDALRDTPEGGVLAISIYPPEMAMEIIRSFWPEAL
jgi:cyanophycin synthetase